MSLCTTLGLALLAPDLGPASGSLSDITAAVAALDSQLLTIA